MSEKLQKVLAREGFASRREIERWITAGRIMVNGEVAKLGERVAQDDLICVDRKPIKRTRISARVIMYHKPEDEICTRDDPKGRPTVFTNLPKLKIGRWINVGRLDINTSGLLLFTNDGELANRLMHPSSRLEREYKVRVFGEADQALLGRLQKGVQLEDGLAAFKRIKDQGGKGLNHWYSVVVTEGRNRMVRRLWASQGLKVSRLMRIRYGKIRLPRDLLPGKCREISQNELKKLPLLGYN